MSLLHPIGLVWAAVAIPVIALYILRIRRRRQVVPTVMLWDQIFQETTPRSLWRHLRHWLSLLMQLAFVLLLALALADPAWSGKSRKPTHWIVLLDQSASMQATDGTSTRFDRARQEAHRIVRSMDARDQATVIAVGTQAVIACGRTYHQPTLHRAIDSLDAHSSPCDLRAALSLARSIDAGQDTRRIVLMTDAGGASQLTEGEKGGAVLSLCGQDTPNVAITGFAVRPRSDNPLELQGMLRAANFGPQTLTAKVRLTRDGRLFDVVSMELKPNQEELRSLHLVQEGAGVLRAELADADSLMADNVALAVLPKVRELRVVLVSAGNVFVEGVLSANPLVRATKVAPAQWKDAVSKADILIFDEFVPPELPGVPALYIHPQRESTLWSLGNEVKHPLISDTDETADVLRHVNLRNCTIVNARPIKAKSPARTVLASFEQPLLLSWSSPAPPKLALAVDVRQGDLPLRTAFPIFMQNTLNYLAGRSDEPVSAYRTGEIASVRAEGSSSRAIDSRGQTVATVVEDDRLRVGPVSDIGLIRVESPGSAVQLAFNLANSTESNLRSSPTTRPTGEASLVAASSAWSWPWWVILAMTGLGLSTLEWCLHQRRRID